PPPGVVGWSPDQATWSDRRSPPRCQRPRRGDLRSGAVGRSGDRPTTAAAPTTHHTPLTAQQPPTRPLTNQTTHFWSPLPNIWSRTLSSGSTRPGTSILLNCTSLGFGPTLPRISILSRLLPTPADSWRTASGTGRTCSTRAQVG